MKTSFEDLSNELLLSIFVYINPRYLHSMFWNLNSRFNGLLETITNLQLIIDGEENIDMITTLASHVGLLQVNSWNEIDLNGFHNLYSLVLVRPSPRQLKQIRAEIMPRLRHLSLFSNVQFIVPKQLIHDAFSKALPSLRWARLGHINLSDLRSTISQSLRHLHISCSQTTMIPFILVTCPQLDYLHIDICRDGDPITSSLPNIVDHPLRQFLLRDYCQSINYKDILSLLPCISNIRKIELQLNCNASFIVLLKHLSDSLRYLRRFDCDITEDPVQSSIDLDTIQQIHPCFSRIRCRIRTKDFQIFTTELSTNH